MIKNNPPKLEPLYDKKVQCILCRHSFTTKKVRSRFVKPKQTDTDFGPLFAPEDGNNPLLYYVVICPQCGYSFTQDFRKSISGTAKQIIIDKISSKKGEDFDYSAQRDFAIAERAYKLAIYCGQLTKEKSIALAKLCLRLGWLYRNVGNESEELRFLNFAAEEFEQAYIKSEFDPLNTPEIYILYMIGELKRRLGAHNEAVQYFSAVTEHQDRSRYTKYVNLARKQWRLTAEEYRTHAE
ncbi:MAG: DUF2225 domain-containing protein [Peptococcaceae bacterium]|nr:DUF2225 domain-containing protein [Peptococcaceae bacterium]